MADDAGITRSCPWCSAPISSLDASDCPACGAHLHEEVSTDVPGVTAVDPEVLRSAGSPRKVTLTFGSLFVRDDDGIPPPSEAEMPALAQPDLEVRREMVRLELDARLAALQAEVRMLESEGEVGPARGAPSAPPGDTVDEPTEPPTDATPDEEPTEPPADAGPA
jgi:hypothetical protein